MTHPPAIPRDGFSPRLAGFYATLGIATGIGMPYFPLWLENKGLDPGQIGIVLATPMVVRIFWVPLATRVADRFSLLRAGMLVASLGSAIGNASMAFADGFGMLILTIAIAALFFTPTFPFADAYALRGLAERRKSYGPVRLWSSAAYIAANIGGGLVIGVIARSNIIWLIVAAFAVGIVCSMTLLPLGPHHESAPGTAPPAKSLWRSPSFVMVILACSLVQASHAVYYGFSTIDWTAKGMSDTAIGSLWALGVIAEIGFFALAGRLDRVLSPVAMIMLGAVGGIVRWGAMALDPAFAVLPFLQVLHALTFCATHMGAMRFLARNVSPGLGATAQGDFAAAQAVIFGSATVLSGVLFRAYGDLAYIAMVLLSVIGLAVIGAVYFRWRESAAHS